MVECDATCDVRLVELRDASHELLCTVCGRVIRWLSEAIVGRGG